MNREHMIEQVERLYAARREGDFSALDSVLAPETEFRFAGSESMTRTFRGGKASSIGDVAQELFARLEMLELEPIDTVVEGRKVAMMWDASFRLGAGEPFRSLLYDLWEFDDEGRIRKGTQFFDTALLAAELSAEQQIAVDAFGNSAPE